MRPHSSAIARIDFPSAKESHINDPVIENLVVAAQLLQILDRILEVRRLASLA